MDGARRLWRGVKRRVPGGVKRRVRSVLRRFDRGSPPKQPLASTPAPSSTVPALVADGCLSVHTESVATARDAAATIDLSVEVTSVDITIANWRRPHAGWSGRLGPVRDLVTHSVWLPKGRTGRARVRAEVANPTPAQDLLDAALAALEPSTRLPAALSAALLVVDGPRPPFLRSSPVPVDGVHPDDPRRAAISAQLVPTDVRLTSDPAAPPADVPVAVYSRYALATPGEPPRVLIDISRANPQGRAAENHDLPAGDLILDLGPDGDVAWRVESHATGSKAIVGRADTPLNEAQRSALTTLRAVAHTSAGTQIDAAAHAAVLAQLAATGVIVAAPDLPPQTRALLSPELAESITAALPSADADPLEWDLRSVVQRRAAMRGHDIGLAPTPARSTTALPTVTALVVSRRPHFVPRVIDYLVAQTYPRLDVVLAMHGVDLDPETRSRLTSLPLPVEVLDVPADVSFGEALAEATLQARGSMVAKIDDDDQYGPEHIWDLVLARRYSGATVVGKPPDFTYLAAEDVTVRRKWMNENFTDVVTGGTILISRADLEAVGGWRPVRRSVDRGLLDRVLKAGGLIYRTHGFGFAYTRHNEGHTWDPGTADWFRQNVTRTWQGLPTILLDATADWQSRVVFDRKAEE